MGVYSDAWQKELVQLSTSFEKLLDPQENRTRTDKQMENENITNFCATRMQPLNFASKSFSCTIVSLPKEISRSLSERTFPLS